MYQIQPLTQMGPLKQLSQVSNNLSKLQSNIMTDGIANAMMRIG